MKIETSMTAIIYTTEELYRNYISSIAEYLSENFDCDVAHQLVTIDDLKNTIECLKSRSIESIRRLFRNGGTMMLAGDAMDYIEKGNVVIKIYEGETFIGNVEEKDINY